MKKKTTLCWINRSEKAVEKNLIYEWSDRIVWPQTQNMNEFVFITSSLFAAIPSSMNGARESSHRRAPKSWLCWSHVAPQHLPCMLFNLFFLPIYWPFHSAKAISFFNSTTFNPFGLLPDWRMPYILHEYWICVGVCSHAICFQRIIVDGMRLHTAV